MSAPSAVQRVLVVRAHPVRESLLQAAGDRAVAALRDAGHEVREIDLYAEDFCATLSKDEWRVRRDITKLAPELRRHAELVGWMNHLVLVYPTWFGSFPAILKGWFDRVWTEGVAYALPPGAARTRSLLRDVRRVTVVTTHGSSKLTNMVQGEPGRRAVRRGLRSLANVRCRTRWVAFYGNDRAEAAQRTAFLDRVGVELRR